MPLSRLLIVLAVMSASTFAAPPSSRTPEERAKVLADEGAALLAKDKLADAEEALREATELAPGNPYYLFNLARAHARLGRHEAAVGDLERAATRGFADFAQITRESDFDALRDLRSYRRLIANKDLYLRGNAKATLAALRQRFGDDGYRYAIDHERRLVFAVALDDAALQQLRAEFAAQADALAAELFDNPPDAYVTVLMPTPADYAKLVRFRNVPGMYVDSSRTLVARERGYVLSHEFAHALHAADRVALGQAEHAPWLSEGLGVMCEAADFTGGRFEPRDNPRFATLPFGARRKGLVPLERLVAMKHAEFIQRPNLTYAQAGYLVLYLHEKGLLRAFYDAYKAGFDDDPTGRVALEKVTEMKLPELHEAFRLWLAARGGRAKP